MTPALEGRYSAQTSEFWVNVMETLNSSDDIYASVPGVLRETCEHFGFGCGFVYVADHTAKLFLKEHHLLYNHDHLRESLELNQTLDARLLKKLTQTKAVFYSAGTDVEPLEERLAELFSAKSMILIPITDASKSIIALTGLVDRRSRRQPDELNLGGAYAVLCALANHVKMYLFERRAASTEKAMRNVMDHMGIDIYVNDFNTHEILYVNASMATPYGGVDKMMGRKCWEALYTDKTGPCDFCPQQKLVGEDGTPSGIYSWDYQRPFDGAWFRVFSSAFAWGDERLAHVVSSVDITESKRNELIIRQMADYDTLTGLPNRRKLLLDLEACIGTCKGYLLFFDLDGFKQVNDSHGHRAGDELLEKLGNMLQGTSITEGRSYRHGGDEFVVLCRNTSAVDLQQLLGVIMANFHHPWALADGEVVCKCSIGVARFPQDGQSPEELLHNADAAMYAAKEAGKGLIRFYHGGKLSDPKEFFSSL